MPRATKPALKLRPTDGLLEDVQLSIPEAWMATLRGKARKLNLPVADLLVQFVGHLASESEANGAIAGGGRRPNQVHPARLPP